MTTEIEKTFFDTFGIAYKDCGKYDRLEECCNTATFCETGECPYGIGGRNYPQISDSILLELLVIMTRYTDIIDGFDNVQELKEFVLKDLIYSLTQSEADIVKQQVQALFEEG